MIRLDDDFLASIGLAALPPEDKQKMLQHIYETLEVRVGMRLARQMTDAQLDEFEKFVDGNQQYALDYLSRYEGWQQDPAYVAQKERAVKQGKPEGAATTEFAALKWLGVNFPDHKQAIEAELDKLKEEIKAQAPAIIEATMSDGGNPPVA
jgi:hypothetical protein